MFANTHKPPYYAVIFTSIRKEGDLGYSKMAELMMNLVQNQEGFLGAESARNDLGITVSYWKDLDAIKKWKKNSEHLIAQQKGKTDWYQHYRVRIAKVERDYEF